MGHAADSDEIPEIPSNELWPIVRDDPRFGVRVLLVRPLDDNLDVSLGHSLTYVPIHDIPAASVELAAKVIEGTAYIQV